MSPSPSWFLVSFPNLPSRRAVRKDTHQEDGFAAGYLYVQNTTHRTDTDNGEDVPGPPYILYLDGELFRCIVLS